MSSLSYVNELYICQKSAFLQDSCQLFYGSGSLTLYHCYLKMHCCGWGAWCNSLSFEAFLSLIQFSSVAQSLQPHRHMPSFPVHHQLPELTQNHVHQLGDAIQPSYPLLFLSPPAFNLSQHQGLFQWVSSSNQVAKVLEFQLQHQSFQWLFRTDFL